MVQEMSYQVFSDVITTWEVLRRKPNYEELAGRLLFERFLSLKPEAKDLFFQLDATNNDDNRMPLLLIESPKFKRHAVYFIRMIHQALELLGPDIELLTDILVDLGARHAGFGVDTTYFPPMRDSILFMLETLLGPRILTPPIRQSWIHVLNAIVTDMVEGCCRRRRGQHPSTTTATRRTSKKLPPSS